MADVLRIFFCISSILPLLPHCAVASRKYNLEAECQKIYKEDLKTVLARFRRTPDYLKIIRDKNSELHWRLLDIITQTRWFYSQRVAEKVEPRLGLDKSEEGKEENDPNCRKSFGRVGVWADPLHVIRARREGSAETTTMSGVQLLDEYKYLHPLLSVTQRNAMKDLGFELAGSLIHSVIASLGPDDGSKSTRHPFGGDLTDLATEVTTTEHVTIHEVTKQSTEKVTPESPEEAETTPKKERMKYVRSGKDVTEGATRMETGSGERSLDDDIKRRHQSTIPSSTVGNSTMVSLTISI